MLARRAVPLAAFALVALVTFGCATDNPLSSIGNIDATAPSAPTNLAAEERGGSLVLTWDASADADVIGYDVYVYAPDPARESAYLKVNGALVTDEEYTIADAPSTMAWYRVKAVDASSNRSPASGALAAAVPGVGSNDGGAMAEPGIERGVRP
jgi:hypothetical protein